MPDRLDALRRAIRDVPDYPRPGILFKDITPLLASPESFRAALDLMQEQAAALRPDRIVAIESRGFILAAPLADRLGVGLVPVRKKGKLPWRHVACTYDLEYGTDTIEMQEDAIQPGQRVVVLDDLLATGGTMQAAVELVRTRGGTVAAAACIIELAFLQGREKLDVPLAAMISYDT